MNHIITGIAVVEYLLGLKLFTEYMDDMDKMDSAANIPPMPRPAYWLFAMCWPVAVFVGAALGQLDRGKG